MNLFAISHSIKVKSEICLLYRTSVYLFYIIFRFILLFYKHDVKSDVPLACIKSPKQHSTSTNQRIINVNTSITPPFNIFSRLPHSASLPNLIEAANKNQNSETDGIVASLDSWVLRNKAAPKKSPSIENIKSSLLNSALLLTMKVLLKESLHQSFTHSRPSMMQFLKIAKTMTNSWRNSQIRNT